MFKLLRIFISLFRIGAIVPGVVDPFLRLNASKLVTIDFGSMNLNHGIRI